MPPLYIVEQGARLNLEQRRLLVSKDGELILKCPLAHTSAVVLFGNITITTPALKRLMGAGIDVIFLTQDGHYEGRLVGPLSKYGQLREQQHAALRDPDLRLRLAQAVVRGKCLNMRTLLLRYNRDLHQPDIASAIERLTWFSERCRRTTTQNALLGVEGSASAAYFSVFRRLFKRDWPFEKRLRRPPPDPVNVLLSFGYTLLTRCLEASVATVGLDPYLGILHVTEYGRPSLALDLVEEFRAIIVDSVVLTCLNGELVTPADFTPGQDPARPVILSEGGKRRFIEAFERRLATPVRHPVTQETLPYNRIFDVQTRLLARCLREQRADYPPFEVR